MNRLPPEAVRTGRPGLSLGCCWGCCLEKADLMTSGGLRLGQGQQEAGVEESSEQDPLPHLEVVECPDLLSPGGMGGLGVGEELTSRAPGWPLPPASAPETPSFHGICLIPVNSRLTSRLCGLTSSLQSSQASFEK